jgi:hypothetical protein
MATILVEILGDSKQFKSELDKAVASTEKANSGFAKMGKAAGVAGLALAGGLAVGLTKSVEAASQAQEETGKLDTAFKNAGLSAKAMTPIVASLESAQRKLGFTNSDTRTSLTKLVTAGDSAKQATHDLAVASDLARFKNESLATATEQLIKVHAGNTRALKEVGIVIPPVTAAVQKLKDAGVDNTTALGRHELALAAVQDKLATGAKAADILSGKIKGQAKEFSDSAAGGMAQFHAQIGALEEKLGTALIPALTQAADVLASLTGFLSAHTNVVQGLVIGLGALSAVLLAVSVHTAIVSAAEAVASAATGVWTAAQWLLNAALDANPIGLVIIAIAGLVAGLALLYTHSETVREIVHDIAQNALPALTTAWNTVKTAVGLLIDYFVGPFKTQFDAISGVINVVKDLLNGNFSQAWTDIKTTIDNVFSDINTMFGGLPDKLGGYVASIGAAALKIGNAIANNISSAVTGGISDVVGFFTALPGKITNALGDLSRLLYNAGASILQGLIDGMTSKLKDVEGLASSIGGKIASLKGPLDYDRVLLVPHGQAIIQGLQAGMQSGLGDLNRLTASIAPSISANVTASPLTASTGGASPGGGNVYVTVNGWVGNDQDIAERIRNELIRKGRRTDGGVLGGFA